MQFSKQTTSISSTHLFSKLFTDYLNQAESVKPFYEFHFNKTDFETYFTKNDFNTVDRTVLVNTLHQQSQLVANTSNLTSTHIDLLKLNNTYTVTTGHQLCLFTGPLYFIYKIISTINFAKTLSQQFTDKHFVPVYWMASEDNDFEEVNHIHTFGKTLLWNSNQKGSVGEFNTSGINDVITELKTVLGDNANADELIQLFETAYLKHTNLADATRYLCNELFGDYGLIILDGNDAQLKSLFKDEFKTDAFQNTSAKCVNETITELTKNYSAQVTPRDINIFYKESGLRERIEQVGEVYQVINTDIKFTAQELETIIDTSPEKLSPNVVLRPLYQQKILPNVAYVGGPGELAYWLEYKAMFDAYRIAMPILVPRHFVMLVDKGTQNKLQKLNLQLQDTFTDGEELIKQFIKTEHADIHLENEKNKLTQLFSEILSAVISIDKTLVGTVEAEKQKAVNGIGSIEQKINRALKQKSETDINQIWSIKGKLFPHNQPQERYDNFTMYYSKYGKSFLKELMEHLAYDLDSLNYTILCEN